MAQPKEWLGATQPEIWEFTSADGAVYVVSS